jgi:hypothetical protein
MFGAKSGQVAARLLASAAQWNVRIVKLLRALQSWRLGTWKKVMDFRQFMIRDTAVYNEDEVKDELDI